MENARLTIHLSALKENAKQALLKADHHLIAVVKNNAYHFGLLESVEAFYQAGVRHFATTSLEECRRIRLAYDDVYLLLLNQTLDFKALRTYKIACTLPSLAFLKEHAEDMAGINWHLEWAGQMRRSGAFTQEELLKTLTLAKTKCLSVTGIWTHFSWADTFEENHFYEQEREAWLSILEKARALHHFDYVHAQNSASFVREDKLLPNHTHARLGIYLYGCLPYSTYPENLLKHALTLQGQVISVQNLSYLQSIGYANAYVAQENKKVAIINLGYGDGLLRSRANMHPVLIRDRRYPLVAIMMSHTVALVDDCVQQGDFVTFYGEQIPVHEFTAKGVGANSEQISALNHETLTIEYSPLD